MAGCRVAGYGFRSRSRNPSRRAVSRRPPPPASCTSLPRIGIFRQKAPRSVGARAVSKCPRENEAAAWTTRGSVGLLMFFLWIGDSGIACSAGSSPFQNGSAERRCMDVVRLLQARRHHCTGAARDMCDARHAPWPMRSRPVRRLRATMRPRTQRHQPAPLAPAGLHRRLTLPLLCRTPSTGRERCGFLHVDNDDIRIHAWMRAALAVLETEGAGRRAGPWRAPPAQG